MKFIQHLSVYISVIFFFILIEECIPQTVNGPLQFKNDPFGTKIYTLKNGLTVYFSVNHTEPKVSTRIAVKTGSKRDPNDATGLAHYLEHMLFKGTDKIGTINYETEQKLINDIIDLYEQHREESDLDKRRLLYRKIDSVSFIASGYAIPNEYDKICASMGASGTNAYTSFEQTVYINEIPSNQLEKWLTLEAERFRNPVMRLFHTELEVVYEEKNRSMDNGSSKAFETLFSALFKNHPYGTQTTIGTVEHLKNPSLKKVIEYYNTYYVPNNMAIILAGDFDPENTIKLIDEKFGNFQYKHIPEFYATSEKPITNPIARTVYSPDAENLLIGFRLPSGMIKDVDVMNMFTSILYNGNAGLIDLNIIKKQKALNASAFAYNLNDYSIFILSGSPRNGQSLEELKDILLSQIELIKKGEFPDWYLEAVINNYKLNLTKANINNNSIAGIYVDVFTGNKPYNYYLETLSRYKEINKQDIIDFANKYFNNNYVVVYKKTGDDTTTQKIVKPELTPVQVNRDIESDMYRSILSEPVQDINPVFIDFNKEIESFNLKGNNKVYTVKNIVNDLFELSFIFDFGNNADKTISTALAYSKILGTHQKSVSGINEEFYRLGCTYNATQNNEKIIISLSGLNENLEPALSLLMSIFSNAKLDKDAYYNLVNDIIKSRENSKLNKNVILRSALLNYAVYGKNSPFTNVLSEYELKSLNPEIFTNFINSLFRYEHTVSYYGPYSKKQLEDILYPYYSTKDMPIEVPKNLIYREVPTEENKIYFVNYNMKQVELLFINRNEPFNKNEVPLINLFNEYFGGSMSSIVFQDLREAKALAYSVSSVFRIPDNVDKYNYLYSYIGTQSDKLDEAMIGFLDLINNIPLSDVSFRSAKDGVIKGIQTNRILKNAIINTYLANLKLGIDYDFRKTIYEKVTEFTLNDIKEFSEKFIKNRNFTFLLIGDRKKINFDSLRKFGKVEELDLEQIFGF